MAKEKSLPDVLLSLTVSLISDLQELRSGKITNVDARTRAQVAREALRSVHLQLQGAKYLMEKAKLIEAPK